MIRRSFLKLLGKCAVISSGILALPPLSWAKQALDYALEGQELIQKKHFSRAVDMLNRSVRLDPDSDWAHGLLGRAYFGLGKKAEAVASFREAIRLNPQDTYSRMMIEILTQKPLPRLEKKRRPLSPLEKEALEEEVVMFDWFEEDQRLAYQVKRVVIDAGHGGFDSGAVGQKGLKEKDVTLDLAVRLHEKLKREGKIKTFLTRTGDYYIPLSARTATANQYQADLLISMHINANERPLPHGCETYFCSEKASSTEAERVAAFENSVLKYDEPYKRKPGYIDIEEILFRFEQKLNWGKSEMFARAFQKRFAERLPLKSRGVHSADFYVLRRAKMPSILLETGFISNPKEEGMLRLSGFRENIVDAIAKGLA
jgi:N-acetylmuramoyl-L-alanine amidase